MIFTQTILIARMFNIFRNDKGFWILIFITIAIDAIILFTVLPHLYK